jgi:hypothetical protein
MEIVVLIEPVTGGYRATAASPFPFTAEGPSREETLLKLRELIDARLRSGAQVTRLVIQTQGNPWLDMAGMWDPQDSLVQEWKQIMAEKRRSEDITSEAS